MLDPQLIRHAARDAAAEVVGRSVADSQPILSSGLIDSLSVLRLITGLETRIGIRIPVEQVQPDDFDSVDLMVETVLRVAP
jgi:acyl carrier protein